MARSKPETEIDFGERLRWMMPDIQNVGWFLLCDKETVSLPTYIKGSAKHSIYAGLDGYWRRVVDKKGNHGWQFTDRPGKPITAKDYLAV